MVLATIAKVAVPVAMISSLRGARVSPTSPTLCITVIAPNMILAERVTNCIVDFIMTVIFLSQITRGFSRDLVFHDLMRKLFGDIGLATTISFTGELVSIIALYFVSLASFTGAINPLYYGFTIVACLVYALAAIDMKVTAATRNRLDTPVMMKKEPVSIALGNLSTRSGDFNVSAVAGSGVPTLNARNNVSGGSGNSVLNATTDERMWDLER
ncbi:hypothetical protein HK102_012208 [Quaeritorhiza haematococci]|nr:hypothetical protein HK102_012208 [Quaeritorhiza haematococci]